MQVEASRTGCWNCKTWGLALSLCTIRSYTRSQPSTSTRGRNYTPFHQVTDRDFQYPSRTRDFHSRIVAGASIRNRTGISRSCPSVSI